MLDRPLDPGVHTDLQSLGELRRAARAQSPQALHDTARQFETEFLKLMVKSMRQAGGSEGGILDSRQSLFYRDLFDEQLALSLSRQGGVGLAERIVRQLGGEPPAPPPPRSPVTASLPPVSPATPAPLTPAAPAEPLPERFDSPRDFVQAMSRHARSAARRLGVDPQVLIAQAALESAWGNAVPRDGSGRSSHNLFGIKAHGGWQGPRVVNDTLEFVEGVAERRRAGFRAYDSWAASFQDYVAFLQDNPRYRQALERAGDREDFVRELHRAGYATDPQYADKILKILDSEPFQALKPAAAEPITEA